MKKRIFAVGLLIGAIGFAQNESDSQQPANAWMRKAENQNKGIEAISGQLRLDRDQYADDIFGRATPLKPDTAGWSHIGQDTAKSDFTKVAELPPVPNRTIVIATFQQFQSRLTQSRKAVYTEVSFSVQHVFETSAPQLVSGSNLTIMLPGGLVQTGGRKHFVSPRSCGLFSAAGQEISACSFVLQPGGFLLGKKVLGTYQRCRECGLEARTSSR